MNITLNRLDPNLPDPVESRRRAAGRMVRFAYAAAVFGVLGFFVIYFGAPLVYLGGPGTVSSYRYVVSMPYTVQVSRMNVAPGAAVKAREEIGQVRSPEQDNIVATYMRALAEVTSRQAELRVKSRVAQESLEASRAYQRLIDEAVAQVQASGLGTLTYRVELLRERALAQRTVVSQEAEIAEATTQLKVLGQFGDHIQQRLAETERSFAEGRLYAPIDGIVATTLARIGQSVLAGTPIAEIHDPVDVFVAWYVPNTRLLDPKVGKKVFVLFGNRRLAGTIETVLPVSAEYGAARVRLMDDHQATQIARIRFNDPTQAPPLNTSVTVHMHYWPFVAAIAAWGVDLLGIGGTEGVPAHAD